MPLGHAKKAGHATLASQEECQTGKNPICGRHTCSGGQSDEPLCWSFGIHFGDCPSNTGQQGGSRRLKVSKKFGVLLEGQIHIAFPKAAKI